MVKTRPTSKFATENISRTREMISDIFGKKTLVLRVETLTYDTFGQLASRSTTDTTFTGDLQFGLDLDQRYLKMGIVEVGDAILYIEPNALTTKPVPDDLIVDGNNVWRITDGIEAPEMGGTVCHYSYRCKREINSSDD